MTQRFLKVNERQWSKTCVQTARLMTIVLIVKHTENDTFKAWTINSPVRLHALKNKRFLVEAKQLLVEGPQKL